MAMMPEDIRARVEEIRERVRAKIDEVRGRLGGSENPGGILQLGILDRVRERVGSTKFLPSGPLRQISTPTATRNRKYWFHNAHTKSEREIKAMGPGPLEKNTITLKKVAPKVLDK